MAPSSYFIRTYVEPHRDFHTKWLSTQTILDLAEQDIEDGKSAHCHIFRVLFILVLLFTLPTWLILTLLVFAELLLRIILFREIAGLFPKRYKSYWNSLRRTAIYVIYVPSVRFRSAGGLRGILLPSTAQYFVEAKRAQQESHKPKLDRLQEELDVVKELLELSREQRFETLSAARDQLKSRGPGSRRSTIDHADEILAKCDRIIKITHRLKEHYDTLQENRHHLKMLIDTQATAESTHYRGLADWSKTTAASYEHILNIISGLSFFGGGVTYSTIFSASRGDIGLMCWAFALFAIGFIVPVVTQTILIWGSNVPAEIPFSTPRLWRFIFGRMVDIAVGSVAAAVAIMNVTIFKLHFPGSVDAANNGGWNFLDADVLPRPSSIMSIAFLGTGVLAIGVVFIFYVLANPKALSRSLVGGYSATSEEKPEDYVRI